jgi:hypothetical protein
MGIPSLRTCVACRTRGARQRLVRLHADAEGWLTVSRPGAAGRGVYVCPHPDCLAKALGGKQLGRALRRPGIRTDPERLGRLFAEELSRRVSMGSGAGA